MENKVFDFQRQDNRFFHGCHSVDTITDELTDPAKCNLQWTMSDATGQLTRGRDVRQPPNASLRWHLTLWCLSCLCSVRASEDPSQPCRLPRQRRLHRRPPPRQSVCFAPRCGALGSTARAGPARPAAGRSVPAAVCGSAGGEAGRGAPRWLPAPHGWPGSGGCFCSTGNWKHTQRLRNPPVHLWQYL